MTEDDRRIADAERAGGLHEFLLLDRQHAAPDQPRVDRDAHDRDGAGHLEGAHQARGRREDHHQDDGEQVDGKGEDQIHDPHDGRVGAAAVVSGDHSQRHPHEQGQQHRRHADDQRDPRAVDDAGEHVTAELVGAQRIVPARCLGGDRLVVDGGMVRGQHVGEDRDDQQHGDDRHADERGDALAETAEADDERRLRARDAGAVDQPRDRQLGLARAASADRRHTARFGPFAHGPPQAYRIRGSRKV